MSSRLFSVSRTLMHRVICLRAVWSRGLGMLSGIALVCLLVVPVSAQTRFLAPVRKVDIANYNTVEECVALVTRLKDSVWRAEPTSDTFPISVDDSIRQTPYPSAFTSMANSCSTRLSLAPDTPKNFRILIPLLLDASRDTDADRMVAELLAKQQPFNGTATDVNRSNAINQALLFYTKARPGRHLSALKLVTAELENTTIDPVSRFQLLVAGGEISMQLNDTVRAAQFIQSAVAVYKTFATQKSSVLRENDVLALGRLMPTELLDSLRRGVSAYLALRQSDNRFKEPTAISEASTIGRVGSRAAPVQGDFWFSADGATSPLVRPSPGRTSLIVFLSQSCRRKAESNGPHRERGPVEEGCYDLYAMFKRVFLQFPNIELIIATQTVGYVWPSKVLEPAEEADLLRQWWLGYHRLPVTLAVSNTPFWRLEAPDHRRIDDAIANETNYNTNFKSAVLTDRDGMIIERFAGFGRTDEKWLTQLLSVLTDQSTTK